MKGPAHIALLDGGSVPDRSLIGGKAWSVARMQSLGLRVPPAFVVTTCVCTYILTHGVAPSELDKEVDDGITWLERVIGRGFGRGHRRLLVSVRSGAPISMPGMMDTVLNLGMNDEAETQLAAECGDPEFARGTHRRFLEMYAGIVLGAVVALDPSGDAAAWREHILGETGEVVPSDVRLQLRNAMAAVFNSWNSRRARRYRDHNHISHDLGTAVTVQAMVFGNMNDRSGTGVLFSRNPLSGDPVPYGEFIRRAQGEDIVSGKHTPMPLSDLEAFLPEVHAELLDAAQLLEAEAGDVQDIEFTIERGTLFLLQTRDAKRAPAAAVRIARDMVAEHCIEPHVALGRLTAEQMRVLLRPRLAADAVDTAALVVQGEAASPGIGYGVIVTDPEEAEIRAGRGEDVVLARRTTSPDDLHGMIAARAIVTETGGSTSHAAVVGRSLGRPCVVGCGEGSLLALVGKDVTVDGTTGRIYSGRLRVEQPAADADDALADVMRWARATSPIEVREDVPDGPVLDLGSDPDDLDRRLSLLPPGGAVCGALFAHHDEVVAKAIAAGARTIVTSSLLPVLVTAANIASTGARKAVL